MLPPDLIINPDSKWRRGFLLLNTVLAAIACIALQSLFGMLLLAILLGFAVFYWLQKPDIAALGLHVDGALWVRDLSGKEVAALVLPTSLVTSVVIVLQLSVAGRRQSLVLWPDSCAAESLRRWRVWLKWQWSEAQGGVDESPDVGA